MRLYVVSFFTGGGGDGEDGGEGGERVHGDFVLLLLLWLRRCSQKGGI